VRGDLDAVAMRNFDERLHLLVGHGSSRDTPVVVGNTARDCDLDPVGTLLDLLACHARQAVGTVSLGVTVTARRHDYPTGCLEARANDLAPVNCGAQSEVVAMVLAHEAQRRDA